MHLAQHITASAGTLPDLRLVIGVAVGVVATLIWHIINRIRRLARTMAFLALAGGLPGFLGHVLDMARHMHWPHT